MIVCLYALTKLLIFQDIQAIMSQHISKLKFENLILKFKIENF